MIKFEIGDHVWVNINTSSSQDLAKDLVRGVVIQVGENGTSFVVDFGSKEPLTTRQRWVGWFRLTRVSLLDLMAEDPL